MFEHDPLDGYVSEDGNESTIETWALEDFADLVPQVA